MKYLPRKSKSQQGVALLMVMGTITLLTAMLATLTFNTQLNKFKVYRRQDQSTAKLMAESGLNLALSRLQLFQEGLNQLEKKKQEKADLNIGSEVLNPLWSLPFAYPLPSLPGANIVQRNAVEEFQKNMLLDGEMAVNISNASQLLNLNLLRVEKNLTEDQDPNSPQQEKQLTPVTNIEEVLTELLEKRLEEERSKREDYDMVYGPATAAQLVKEIKFYVNEPGGVEDPDFGDVEILYGEYPAKHAPLSSVSELYQLQGWRDVHIQLIKDQVTTQGLKLLDLNALNEQGLKLLIPTLTPEQAKQIIKKRGSGPQAKGFASFSEFYEFVVVKTNIIDGDVLQQRYNKLIQAGIRFDTKASLFRVVARGKKELSSYTLNALVSIPSEEIHRPAAKPDKDGKCPQEYKLKTEAKEGELDLAAPPPVGSGSSTLCYPLIAKDQHGNPKPLPYVFYPPRVVELVAE